MRENDDPKVRIRSLSIGVKGSNGDWLAAPRTFTVEFRNGQPVGSRLSCASCDRLLTADTASCPDCGQEAPCTP